jgi:hypothetical protein
VPGTKAHAPFHRQQHAAQEDQPHERRQHPIEACINHGDDCSGSGFGETPAGDEVPRVSERAVSE